MKKFFTIKCKTANQDINIDYNLVLKPLEIERITVLTTGNFYYQNHPATLEELFDLFKQYGKETYKYLDGVGTLIFIDKNTNKIYFFTDFFNSNLPVYYYSNHEETIISSEIKKIIPYIKEEPSFNNDGVRDFLEKGFIVGNNTLIKDIYKLPGKKYMIYNIKSNTFSFHKMSTPLSYLGVKQVSEDSYKSSFENVVKSIIRDNYCLPLTSGFDTNFIFHFIRKNTPKDIKINAICLGGAIGWNEIRDAKAILENYENVSLTTDIIDDKTFNCYPEIVKILEGNIYEHGIFLQYKLANLVKNEGYERIILGECADQLLNYNVAHEHSDLFKRLVHKLKSLKAILFNNMSIVPYKNFYEMGAYKIIKKSGILLNYYGIETEHPYVRREFMKEELNASIKNDFSKSFHKKTIKNIVKEDVSNLLIKKPGATELRTLYIGDITYDDLVKYGKKSEYYKKINFNDEIYEMHYYMKLAYLNLFKEIFLTKENNYLNDNCEMPKLGYFINK